MSSLIVAPPVAVSFTDWAEALSSRAAAGEPVKCLLSARRLLDIFGPDALPALPVGKPGQWSDARWLLHASAEESEGSDGTSTWFLSLGPGREFEGSVTLTSKQAESIADRELLALASVAVGTAQRAMVLARRRAGKRMISGRPLIELQAAGHRLARVAALITQARAYLRALCRDEDAGIGAGYRAAAGAAAAAEAAFACAQALVQIYGAAGTSDAEPAAAFAACQAAASAAGAPARLWLHAGSRRPLRPTTNARSQAVAT
ncbi:acyl-CoA dehydrogenase family protein [Rugosimonospora acidiphila]|uniref:acyl-CoA dehydrogenase family protein n=1 Tax=Rugosimonospora acidiphila TaxID=556531 RepID=UPI0031EFE96D